MVWLLWYFVMNMYDKMMYGWSYNDESWYACKYDMHVCVWWCMDSLVIVKPAWFICLEGFGESGKRVSFNHKALSWSYQECSYLSFWWAGTFIACKSYEK